MTSTKLILKDDKTAAIVRIDEHGAMVRSIVKVKFDAAQKHYYPGKSYKDESGKWMPKPRIITATGFDHLNKYAPLAWIPQATVFNDVGVAVGNPHIERVGGCIQSVRVRRFAVGRTMDGQLRCLDLTLQYDPLQYFYSDMLTDYDSDKLGDKARILPAETAKKECSNPGGGEVLATIPVTPGVVLLYDVTNKQARSRQKEYSERTKFADRLATSICDRNILAKFWGVRVVPESGYILVPQWYADKELTPERLEERIVTKGGVVMIDGEQVVVESAVVAANSEDMETIKHELVADEEGRSQEIDIPDNDEEDQPRDRSAEEILKGIRSMAKNVGVEKAKSILKPILTEIKIAFANIGTIEDTEVLTRIEKTLFDSRNSTT